MDVQMNLEFQSYLSRHTPFCYCKNRSRKKFMLVTCFKFLDLPDPFVLKSTMNINSISTPFESIIKKSLTC